MTIKEMDVGTGKTSILDDINLSTIKALGWWIAIACVIKGLIGWFITKEFNAENFLTVDTLWIFGKIAIWAAIAFVVFKIIGLTIMTVIFLGGAYIAIRAIFPDLPMLVSEKFSTIMFLAYYIIYVGFLQGFPNARDK